MRGLGEGPLADLKAEFYKVLKVEFEAQRSLKIRDIKFAKVV